MGRIATKQGWYWNRAVSGRLVPRRLINVNTLELHDNSDTDRIYATLSHRWSDEEISFEAYCNPAERKGLGFEKIEAFCAFLREYEYGLDGTNQKNAESIKVEWCWVDTCCIDKRSSAELSEAINAMAAWYENSAFCIAYLADVENIDELPQSEWFRRGWTLQELIFPPAVVFCNTDWELIATLDTFNTETKTLITQVTGIPNQCLKDTQAIYAQSVASRLSWASQRHTTRKEDEAYCLLGLFAISLPLVYGEGDKAFIRLQEEIIKQCDDESIFAWSAPNLEPSRTLFPLLARSPAHFQHSGNVICAEIETREPYQITNKGLKFEARPVQFGSPQNPGRELYLIQLNCCLIKQSNSRITFEACLIAVIKGIRGGYGASFARVHPWSLSGGLWEHALHAKTTSRVTRLPKQHFYLALEPTRVSHAGSWSESKDRFKRRDVLTSLETRCSTLMTGLEASSTVAQVTDGMLIVNKSKRKSEITLDDSVGDMPWLDTPSWKQIKPDELADEEWGGW